MKQKTYFNFKQLFEQTEEKLVALSEKDLPELRAGKIWTLLFYAELPDDISRLEELAADIKAHPTIESLNFINQGNRYLFNQSRIMAERLLFKPPHRGVSPSFSDHEHTSSAATVQNKGITQLDGFENILAKLAYIREQVNNIAFNDKDRGEAKRLADNQINRFTTVCTDLVNALIVLRDNRSCIASMLNDWYDEFYEKHWQKMRKDIALIYKTNNNVKFWAEQKESEVKVFKENVLYQFYESAFDDKTMRCDYVSLMQRFLGRQSQGITSLFPAIDIDKALTDLFVSINKMEAYDALLNGDPLPGYEPLIPEEQEESTPKELTPDERRSATKGRKPKPGRPNDEFKDFLIIDYTSLTLPALEKKYKKMAEGQKGKTLAIRMRIGVLANELTGMPSHAAIENLVGTIGGAGSRQAYDKYKDERFTNEETDKELAELKELGIDFPSFNG